MIVEKVLSSKVANYGFNAASEKFEDLVAAGVIDPAKSPAPLSKTQPRSPTVQDDKSDGGMGGMGGSMGGMGMGM